MSATAWADDPITVCGTKLTDTLTGPAEFAAWSSYGGDDVCQVTPKVLTCDLSRPSTRRGCGSDLFVTVRTTGQGAISHRGVIASGRITTAPTTA